MLGIGSVVCSSIFCLVESKVAEPIIPLGLFRNRTFNVSATVGFVIGFTMFGSIVYLPLYLQIVHGAIADDCPGSSCCPWWGACSSPSS